MARPRVRLGELLVEAGILTREQLEEMLATQKRDGRRLGTLLVESGLVTETQVTQILSQQLSVPWVSLYHIDFSRQLLDLVPRDIAEKYCLVPIFVRRVRGYGNTLYVAMDDPTDERAQSEVGQFAGLPVRTMIAPPADIRAAIRVYYGAGQDEPSLAEAVAEVERASMPGVEPETPPAELPAITGVPAEPAVIEAAKPEAEAVEAEPEQAPAPPQVAAEPEAAAEAGEAPAESATPAVQAPASEADAEPAVTPSPPESGPQIEAREIELPAPRGKPRRMVTLTLLDGTEINLPARGGKSAPGKAAEAELTARDLVAALRAVASGADSKEIMGESPKWEAMFAALLAVLLKKHLIADWEFVEEYKKR